MTLKQSLASLLPYLFAIAALLVSVYCPRLHRSVWRLSAYLTAVVLISIGFCVWVVSG